jgi:GNAT superfamily N-acetyltransferase
MTVKDPTTAPTAQGHIHVIEVNTPKLFPGTTFPAPGSETTVQANYTSTQSKPKSHPGPTINSIPTTITLYDSRNLSAAGLIPTLHDLINTAFSNSHSRAESMGDSSLRLHSHDQLVRELSGPGTFTYVITYTGTNIAIAVASGKLYKSTGPRQPARLEDPKTAFTRSGASEPNTEGWELSSMAVDPTLQRQGLAGLLMDLVEGEVKRRFLVARDEGGKAGVGLVMLLTTIKEINWGFYSRRGYAADYETYHGPEWLGSEGPFTVVHMSKRIDV